MQFLILFIIAMLVSSIGFKKFVWFISLGYGFSMAAIGLTMLVLNFNHLNIVTILICLLLIIYGLRLGLYLFIREKKSVSYAKTMKNDIKDGSSMPMFLKVMVWLSCALLYVAESSPILFRIQHHSSIDTCAIVGMIIMASGIILESYSDYTKNNFKKSHPKSICNVGIFQLVRCPNYLGEVLTWSGVFISGITIYNDLVETLVALLGYICIVYIMFGGARRLEIRQNKNYANDEVYQKYVKEVPILLPFIPLYSVEKYKWLVG